MLQWELPSEWQCVELRFLLYGSQEWNWPLRVHASPNYGMTLLRQSVLSELSVPLARESRWVAARALAHLRLP